MTAFVLVHGAYRGGWIWERLVPLLRDAGHEAYTVTLSGLGDRGHLLGLDTGLNSHVREVVAMVEGVGSVEVALVGHSYGGMVITGVMDAVSRRVRHLVYLDAPVPDDGRSLFDLMGPARRDALRASAVPRSGALVLPVADGDPWGVTNAADRRWMRERMRPQPLRTFEEPVRARGGAGTRTYIRCTRGTGAASPVSRSAERARAQREWRYHEIATAHDAMVTAPRELAGLLCALD